MGRIIRNQIIAGTGVDSHGDNLDKATLKSLFEQMSKSMPWGIEHDIARSPAVRMLDKRFVQLEDGEYAITVDLEVLDEQALAASGGFSISYKRVTRRYGSGEPQCQVLLNPRQFDFDRASDIVRETLPDTSFDVTERIEKADILVTAIIAIAVFVGGQFATGFLNAAGAELYENLRTKLRRKDNTPGPVVFQFHVRVQMAGLAPLLILVVPAQTPQALLKQINQDTLAPLFADLEPGRVPERIVASVQSDGTLLRDNVQYSS